MKRKLFFLVVILSMLNGFSQELPKSAYGKYGGEMPRYKVEVGDVLIDIEKHDVFITILSKMIIYEGGNLSLEGTYTVFKQNKKEYVVKTRLSNGKSMEYEIEFIWKKKEQKIYLTQKNGQSEAVLERLDD